MPRATRCVLTACCVLGGALLSTPRAAAAPAPDLSATTLYTETVHACRTIDLATWRHPARDVLRAAQAEVNKVELCNGDRFPVFTVSLPYDVDGQTDHYFNKLYADLAEANGFWSFALVDVSDDVVINVSVQRSSHDVTLSYEDFKAPVGQARQRP